MKITWIGQAGLLFENENLRVLVDPYLSDSVVKVEPRNYRRIPIKEELFDIKPDVMIFTHNHLDHYDPETAPRFITETSRVTVLAPSSVWNVVRKIGGEHNNYVLFNRKTTWTQNGVRFTAVKAEHSDPAAIGVLLDDGEKRYYVTGDTLYNEEIFADLPAGIDTLFLPVNGVGCNMNMTDAAAFAKRVSAAHTVPLHFGMFDELDVSSFDCENKVIPTVYREIVL